MKVRRVVTCHGANGKSTFQSDGLPPRGKVFTHIPGMSQYLVGATEPTSTIPAGLDPTPSTKSFHPDLGATRFIVVTFPPDSVLAEAVGKGPAAMDEYREETPGIADRFEPDGMHCTETIDYGVVLEGELWLELDDGQTMHLRPHDCVVQNGTRHTWRNKTDQPSTIAFVLVGVERR